MQAAILTLCASQAVHANTPATFTCVIDMRCAGVWTDCTRSTQKARLSIPGEHAPIKISVDDETLRFDDVSHPVEGLGVSASGIDPVTRGYNKMTFHKGRLGVVLSGDADNDGLFFATGSFAGTCERAE